jgi:membrane-associated protein
MEFVKTILDLLLHLEDFLRIFIQDNGILIYWLFFLIVFAETGLVVMPFLPGDSLLFIAGMLAHDTDSGLNPFLLIATFIIAAFLGDNTNYFIGKTFGARVFTRDYRFLKRSHLTQTQDFFAKHGGKTIIYARFVPIVRTFAPFVAGVGSMPYRKFISLSVLGAILWVVGFVTAGYLLGQIDWVKHNVTKMALGIVFLSVLPVLLEVAKGKKTKVQG